MAPARYFWKDVLKRSLKETLVESLGFRSVEQVVIKGIYAVGILGALLWGGSPDAGWDQVVQYIGAVCMVPIIFMLIWAWNFIRLPAKDDANKILEIGDLRAQLDVKEKRGLAAKKLQVAIMNFYNLKNQINKISDHAEVDNMSASFDELKGEIFSALADTLSEPEIYSLSVVAPSTLVYTGYAPKNRMMVLLDGYIGNAKRLLDEYTK